MKKIFLIIIIISASLNTISQNVLKYRAFQFGIIDFKTYKGSVEWKDAGNVLIVVTLQKVTVYSKKEQDYDIISEATQKYDEENKCRQLIFDVVDQDGTKCVMMISKYDSVDKDTGLIAVLTVNYTDFSWSYRMRDNE